MISQPSLLLLHAIHKDIHLFIIKAQPSSYQSTLCCGIPIIPHGILDLLSFGPDIVITVSRKRHTELLQEGILPWPFPCKDSKSSSHSPSIIPNSRSSLQGNTWVSTLSQTERYSASSQPERSRRLRCGLYGKRGCTLLACRGLSDGGRGVSRLRQTSHLHCQY